MIDLILSLYILISTVVLSAFFNWLFKHVGRAALVSWVLIQCCLGAWYIYAPDPTLFRTWITALAPSAFLALVVGLPWEVARRRAIRRAGDAKRTSGEFACPHCGLSYDREREEDRCPDCGGAVDGAPGILG